MFIYLLCKYNHFVDKEFGIKMLSKEKVLLTKMKLLEKEIQ